jgi:cell division protein FtsW
MNRLALRSGRLPLAACALALLCALQLLCLLRTPAAYTPGRIEVRLRPGEALTLGRRELAAPQADSAHLALRRDASGAWWLHNASAGRQLLLQQGGKDRSTGTATLRAGQRLRLGAASFAVTAAGGQQLSFTDGAHHWRYDGATLLRDGAAQPPCPDARPAARAVAAWNRWLPRLFAMPRPISFGGNLHCGNRVGIENIATGSATIASAGASMLLQGPAGAGRTPLMLEDGNSTTDLAHREERLDGIASIVVGHTRLATALEAGTLALRPVSHVALYNERQLQLPPEVAWQWQERDLWAAPRSAAWLAALAIGGAVLACALCGGRRQPQSRTLGPAVRASTGALLAAAGIGSVVLQRAGTPLGIGVSMLLAWAALWYAMLAPNRLNLALAAGLLLLATGLLAQLEMGLAAPDSAWPRHFQKSAALLALGLGLGTWFSTAAPRAPIPQARAEGLLLLLAAAALAALALQVVYGNETGVFDLQPVEFAKLALAALTAHCIAIGLGAGTPASNTLLRWLRLFTPALLFAALLGVALVQVDDYSPLVLLLVWAGTIALAWALAARRHGAALVLGALACVAVLGIAGLRSAETAQVAQWNFYAERFLVWLDPATHPHTGQQLLLGASAVAEGGWLGADRLLGLTTLGQNAGAVMRIPAVQDDFAPSFFLNRHGLAAALVLWALQALFVAGLLQSAASAWSASVRSGDFRHAWLARFRCFTLCGGAAFVFGHFLLSWGTNLAIFPIMGQPMSFLSAGGSHLLFFICPLLVIGSASAQSLEESHHAGLCAT